MIYTRYAVVPRIYTRVPYDTAYRTPDMAYRTPGHYCTQPMEMCVELSLQTYHIQYRLLGNLLNSKEPLKSEETQKNVRCHP